MSECMKEGCEANFDNPATIKCIVPCFSGGKWIRVSLCRGCFLKSDSMNTTELLEWLKIKD